MYGITATHWAPVSWPCHSIHTLKTCLEKEVLKLKDLPSPSKLAQPLSFYPHSEDMPGKRSTANTCFRICTLSHITLSTQKRSTKDLREPRSCVNLDHLVKHANPETSCTAATLWPSHRKKKHWKWSAKTRFRICAKTWTSCTQRNSLPELRRWKWRSKSSNLISHLIYDAWPTVHMKLAFAIRSDQWPTWVERSAYETSFWLTS